MAPLDAQKRLELLERIAVMSGSGAPSVPKKEPTFSRTQKEFANLFADPAKFAKVRKEVDDFLALKVLPSSQRKRTCAELRWKYLVKEYSPHIPEHQHWDEETVLAHYKYMLPMIVLIYKGRKRGRENIQTKTLDENMMLFAWLIEENTRNKSGESVGAHLLKKGGILSELQNQKMTLVKLHNLDRQQDKKLYCGQPELKLLVEDALKSTEQSGRAVGLQRICIVLFIFFIGVRPGSLGPAETSYLVEKKYPTLANVEIFTLGYMTFRVEVDIQNFKGFNNTMCGQSRVYVLEPVKNWFNVPFDLSFYFVCMLLARGALEDIDSLDDLRKCKLHQIHIHEHMLDQPLFLACTGGAFLVPEAPMSSANITAMLRMLAEDAGILGATSYAFRRGASNEYETAVDKELKEVMLAHASTHTTNIDAAASQINEKQRDLLTKSQLKTGNAIRAIHLLLNMKPVLDSPDHVPTSLSPEKETDAGELTEEQVRRTFFTPFFRPIDPSNLYDALAHNISSIKKNKTMKRRASDSALDQAEHNLRIPTTESSARKKHKTITTNQDQVKDTIKNVAKASDADVPAAGSLAQHGLSVDPFVHGASTVMEPLSTNRSAASASESSKPSALDPDSTLAFVDGPAIHSLAAKLRSKMQAADRRTTGDDDDAYTDSEEDEIDPQLTSFFEKATNVFTPFEPWYKSVAANSAVLEDLTENITDTESLVPKKPAVKAAAVRNAFLDIVMAPLTL